MKHIIIAVLALAFLSACDNYDADNKKFKNAVYLDVSQTNQVQPTTISNTLSVVEKPLQVVLTYPANNDVTVSIKVDPALVDIYNVRHGTLWTMLDAKYYSLSNETVTIPKGKTESEIITLFLKNLTGEGEEQVDALPIDETYLLPIRISHSSMSVIDGSSVAYYVVKRSSAITVAAQLTNNWISFPSLDVASDNSMVFNGLTAVTYEAFVFIDEFATEINKTPVSISSIMGVEQYLLLRFGDTNYERQQLQFDGSGSGSAFGKFPKRDATKTLNSGEWYHIAATYDQITREVHIYVNGKIQSKGSDMGILVPDKDNKINLAMRALYDLWFTASEADKDKYKGYEALNDAYQFFISRSYNDDRPLNGKIAEARVWSVARTAEQIWENMYKIENPEEEATLIGYWKFNDGKGNQIKDYSRYGNDGVAEKEVIWPAGIEIPIINE